MTTLQEQLRAGFLDYFNNYLTVEKVNSTEGFKSSIREFAWDNNIAESDMLIIIEMGNRYHDLYIKKDEVEVGGNE